MSKFKMFIEYDGTRYSGWQKQRDSKTIQGTLQRIAEDIFNTREVDIQGAGRTDAGVHALCQIASLDVRTMLAPEIIRMKFNDLLPYDINILEIEKAPNQFHARKDVEMRSYLYQISKRRTAFGKQFVWWIKDKLDTKKMKSALQFFIGMHDFASFTDKNIEEKSTKVFINNITLTEVDDLILIRIIGSHFLWKQVRRMIGVTAEVGRNHLTETDLIKYLTSLSNEPAKFTAPPSGLFLEQVIYKGEKFNEEFSPLIKIS
ncbi:MAG: tRNA pseudouridine(38-40) synthase TruA [Ignavibacteriaceae bacterium]|jgi:tRNA pseudouridine38-40 synthase|nr:tRNA pseudouridine(38-40) synthase TruA [Ignavibacteriaceae bacterium]